MDEQQNTQIEPTLLSPPPSHKKLIIGIVAGFVLIVAGSAGAALYVFTQQEETEPIFCIQDVKECSDGSYVGREGPNCEFAECSVVEDVNTDISGWKTYRNDEYGFEFTYPKSKYLHVFSDESVAIWQNFEDYNNRTNLPADINVYSIRETYEKARRLELYSGTEPDKRSLKDYLDVLGVEEEFKYWKELWGEKYTEGTIKEIQIGNNLYLTWDWLPVDDITDLGTSFVILLGDDRVLQIDIWNQKDASSSWLNQILSTFKFIEPQVSVDSEDTTLPATTEEIKGTSKLVDSPRIIRCNPMYYAQEYFEKMKPICSYNVPSITYIDGSSITSLSLL